MDLILFHKKHFMERTKKMIYKNIQLFNISEIIFDKTTKAYALLRLPAYCEKTMLLQGKRMNRSSIGVEFRFRTKTSVTITLKSNDDNGTVVYLYIGDKQAAYDVAKFTIMHEPKSITIDYRLLESVYAAKLGLNRYAPELFRLVFDGSEVQLVDISGEPLLPKEEDSPDTIYVAYGSSISANSISFLPNLGYVGLLGDALKATTYNLAFPGSCRMEPEVAKYFAEELTFDYLTLEFGINVINEWDFETFEHKVVNFLTVVAHAHPSALIYVTDIFSYFNKLCGVSDEKLMEYREIVKTAVKALSLRNVTYIAGDILLPSSENLCTDLVHPDIKGHSEIFNNLIKVVKYS